MRPRLCSDSLGALHVPAQGFRTVRTQNGFHGHPGHDTVSPTPHLTMRGVTEHCADGKGPVAAAVPSRRTGRAASLGGVGDLWVYMFIYILLWPPRGRASATPRRGGLGSHAPGGEAWEATPPPQAPASPLTAR